ncbi:MAG: hypothetical protein ACE5EC_00970, partial [Phycisphaerae bacterium]
MATLLVPNGCDRVNGDPMPKDWIIASPWKERDRLARTLGASPIVAQMLYNRGVGDEADARQFLDPQLGDMLPPEAM